MSKLLIVAATTAEIAPLLNQLGHISTPANAGIIQLNGQVHLLITGVGMVNTAYMLGKYLTPDYTLAINAGICGAFNRQLAYGEVVNITEDRLVEMGAEDGDLFIPYEGLGLGGTSGYNARTPRNIVALSALRVLRGITVNKVHGNHHSIKKVQEIYPADVESMEGAAFLRACSDYSFSCIQLRSVSNYVERRDKSKWQIGVAVKNLNEVLLNIINELNQTS